MSVKFNPNIICFACNWCSYTGADMAGTSRMKYPATIRIIRVPCSGRVNPTFIMKAYQKGADGVLIAGCHPGDCHYNTGNYFAKRRFLLATRFMNYIGIDAKRLRMEWISAAEGVKFARVMTEFSATISELGPNWREREEV
ncbi:MAG: hydrogenase iron-sulfur subunit [Alkaliphilus sp.]